MRNFVVTEAGEQSEVGERSAPSGTAVGTERNGVRLRAERRWERSGTAVGSEQNRGLIHEECVEDAGVVAVVGDLEAEAVLAVGGTEPAVAQVTGKG